MMHMPARLQITAANPDPAIFDLPWQIPLEQWPEEILAAYPRGISRHVVRFVRVSGRVLAIKEIGESVAHREYQLLWDLKRLDVPCVTPEIGRASWRERAKRSLVHGLTHRTLLRNRCIDKTKKKMMSR